MNYEGSTSSFTLHLSSFRIKLAGAPGFEPRSTAPKAGVLPLHHAPVRGTLYHSDERRATPAPCSGMVCHFFWEEPLSFGSLSGPVNRIGMVLPGARPSFWACSKEMTSGLAGALAGC